MNSLGPSGDAIARSTQLALDRYDTDKILNGYLDYYDRILEPWVDKPVRLLEIGVFKGGSLQLWRDYFPHGTIAGIDLRSLDGLKLGERIHLFQGSQSDPAFLSGVANTVAPEGFDIIIDDGAHIGTLTKAAFWHLFDQHLKKGGLYVIEDWGTGYWDDWPDGKSLQTRRAVRGSLVSRMMDRIAPGRKVASPCHSYGMVGFVKELVDEQGAADVTRRCLSGKASRSSRFESLLITPSIVFVRKAHGV